MPSKFMTRMTGWLEATRWWGNGTFTKKWLLYSLLTAHHQDFPSETHWKCFTQKCVQNVRLSPAIVSIILNVTAHFAANCFRLLIITFFTLDVSSLFSMPLWCAGWLRHCSACFTLRPFSTFSDIVLQQFILYTHLMAHRKAGDQARGTNRAVWQ